MRLTIADHATTNTSTCPTTQLSSQLVAHCKHNTSWSHTPPRGPPTAILPQSPLPVTALLPLGGGSAAAAAASAAAVAAAVAAAAASCIHATHVPLHNVVP